MKTIKVEKEFQIPGTDVVVESGDVLHVAEAGDMYGFKLSLLTTAKWIKEFCSTSDGKQDSIVRAKISDPVSLIRLRAALVQYIAHGGNETRLGSGLGANVAQQIIDKVTDETLGKMIGIAKELHMSGKLPF